MAVKTENKFVVDASFILSFLLNENNKKVEKFFSDYKDGKISLISCSLLDYEIGNGLRSANLRKRLTKLEAEKLYQAYLRFEINKENINYSYVLKFALSRNISFYDASYIKLAQKLSLILLTLD